MHRKRMRICSISTKDFPRSLPSNHKVEPPFIQPFRYLDVLCSRDRLVGTCLEKYGLSRMNVRSVADRDNGPHLIQMPRSVRRDHPDKDVLNQSPVSQCISDRTRRGQQTSNFQEITTSRESLAKGAGSFCQSGFLELTNG